MKDIKNENKIDRIIRFVVAILTGIVVYFSHGIVKDIWLVITIIALLSSLTGFSLFYKIIGIRTNHKTKKERK